MRIGILGTGTFAGALATGWARAGHDIVIGGRSPAKAEALAEKVGGVARPLADLPDGADAVLLAVTWTGVDEVLSAVGSLTGIPLIDPTNPVDHGVGVHKLDGSFAGHVAERAPGALVVKAFQLFPAALWTAPGTGKATVAMCGDDSRALDVVGSLVRDVGGTPAVLGGLDRARQLEEVAGFVIGLAFAGVDPRSAVPAVP